MPNAKAVEIEEPSEQSVNQILKNYFINGTASGIYFLKDVSVGTFHFFNRQLQAIPTFFRTVRQNKQALAVVKDTGRIAVDVGAIVAVQAVNNYLQNAIEENTPEEGMLIPYTLMASAAVLNIGVWLWKQRQRLKIALRSFVMLTQQSGVYNKATKELDVRTKFDNSACEGCSKMRHYKGDFKDWILFYAQQFLLEYGLSSIPYIGRPAAAFLETLLRGQLILSYRLANEGICERHRALYFQQYLELCLSMGVSVEAASYLLAQMVEMLSGVPKDVFESRLKDLVSVYAIGLTHCMTIPPSKKISNRPNPLALTHFLTSELLEVQMAGVKARAPEWLRMMESDEETIDFIALIHNCIQIYRDPKTESILIFFVPEMMLGLKPFFHDEVVSHHWEPIQKTLVDTLDLIKDLVDEYVDPNSRGLKGKLIEWVNRVEINGSNLTTKAVKYYFNISEEVTKKLIVFFKSPEYKEWSAKIRQELILTGPQRTDKLEKEDIEKLRTALRARQQKRGLSLRDAVTVRDKESAVVRENVSVHAAQVTPAVVEIQDDIGQGAKPSFPKNLEKVINRSISGVRDYQQGPFALNDKGQKRKIVYQKLLEHLETPVQKLLVCYALSKNTKTTDLRTSVQEAIAQNALIHARYLRETFVYLKEAKWSDNTPTIEDWVNTINALANEAHKATMFIQINELMGRIKEALPKDVSEPEEAPSLL